MESFERRDHRRKNHLRWSISEEPTPRLSKLTFALIRISHPKLLRTPERFGRLNQFSRARQEFEKRR